MDISDFFNSYSIGYEWLSRLMTILPSIILGLITAIVIIAAFRIIIKATLAALIGKTYAGIVSKILELLTAAIFILQAKSNPAGIFTAVAILGGMMEAILIRFNLR